MCTRCKKNVAVIYVTKVENGVTTNEGLCLKCARELNIGPVQDLMDRLNLTDEDLDNISEEMVEAMSGMEHLIPHEPEEGEDDSADEGRTATFPFMTRLFGGPNGPGAGNAPGQEQGGADGTGPARRGKDKKTKFLDTYSICLTDQAREGKLDRLVGREKEIERTVQILNRRQKNNPCLIGEPGVGKTAIAEGLARRIAEGKVPYKLLGKEVHLLDLTALVAGTQFRGQFESRVKGLIEEVKAAKNVILFIDEVHNLVGTGDAGTS